MAFLARDRDALYCQAMARICASCGRSNPDDDAYCEHCGNPLTTQQVVAHPPAKRGQWLIIALVLAALAAGTVVFVLSRDDPAKQGLLSVDRSPAGSGPAPTVTVTATPTVPATPEDAATEQKKSSASPYEFVAYTITANGCLNLRETPDGDVIMCVPEGRKVAHPASSEPEFVAGDKWYKVIVCDDDSPNEFEGWMASGDGRFLKRGERFREETHLC